MKLSIDKKEKLKCFADRAIALCYIILIFTFSTPKFTSFNYNPHIDLTNMAPHLITFVVSFITIATFWVAQSRILRLKQGISLNIIRQYRAYFICLVLFSVTAVSVSSNPFAKFPLIIYTILLLAIAIIHVSMLYCTLKSTGGSYSITGVNSSLKKTALVGPVCYLSAIAASFVNVYISFASIIAAIFFYIFFMKNLKSA